MSMKRFHQKKKKNKTKRYVDIQQKIKSKNVKITADNKSIMTNHQIENAKLRSNQQPKICHIETESIHYQ